MNREVTIDLDEGRYLRNVCCLACREEVTGRAGMATPVAMYIVSIDCSECLESIVDFDLDHTAMRYDGQYWRAA